MSLVFLGAVAACSASSGKSFFGTGGGVAPGARTGAAGAGAGGSAGGSSDTGESGGIVFDAGTATSGGSAACVVTDPDADMDNDGWTPAQGDCNDCDPNVNPGAIDTITAVDGGTILGDEDCDGTPGEVPQPCDDGLAVDEPDPMNGAKAVELCTPLTDPRKWGLKSAKWVLPDGSPPPATAPGSTNFPLGFGLLSTFGPNVKVQGGKRMLALSSGSARQPTDPGYHNVSGFDKGYTSNSPMGYPKESPACPGIITGDPHDGVGLEVVLVAPTNAHGFSFSFDFFTYEWPKWVCSTYNDFFVALLSPVPAGQADGNISFDSMGNPVSVNNAFVDACGCSSGPPCTTGFPPTLKTFPCTLGDSKLVGTGFGKDTGGSDHASTYWLETKAPVHPHEEITLRWAVYDSSDGILDTTTLVDNFQWIAAPGVSVGTNPVSQPK
jgi:hypothetical protein